MALATTAQTPVPQPPAPSGRHGTASAHRPTSVVGRLKRLAKWVLPVSVRHKLLVWQQRVTTWPPPGMVRFGSLRRVTPVNRLFGFGRGLSIDRYYIERFLARHAGDVQGRVLEIGDDTYTRRFGGGRVTASDVLHAVEGNPSATLVANLEDAGEIASGTFQCIICTQTLQYLYGVKAAVRTLHRILKPGGVLLATVPGISQISRYDMDRWGEYWRFTTRSLQRLFADAFPGGTVTVEAHGNVLVAIAFLHGLAAEELRREELDRLDPAYEVSLTVRAVKSTGESLAAERA